MPSRRGPKVERFYHSTAWRKCQAGFKKYRHYTCEICGGPGYLVHHVKPLTEANVDDPKISLDWSNLQLLCTECHTRLHYQQGDFPGQTPTPHIVQFDRSGRVTVIDREDECPVPDDGPSEKEGGDR